MYNPLTVMYPKLLMKLRIELIKFNGSRSLKRSLTFSHSTILGVLYQSLRIKILLIVNGFLQLRRMNLGNLKNIKRG